MVQRKAARFATSNYTREPGTVTTILQNLGWQTLENRRKMARLTLFYKSINGEAAVNIPPYLTKPTTRTRQYHSQRFSRLSTSTDTYKYSFNPRTISDWNNIPPEVILSPSVDSFRESLQKQMQTSTPVFTVFYFTFVNIFFNRTPRLTFAQQYLRNGFQLHNNSIDVDVDVPLLSLNTRVYLFL
jgi:hypothetical protein